MDVEEIPGASPDACDDNWVQTEPWAAIVLENAHKEIGIWYGSTIVACWYIKIQIQDEWNLYLVCLKRICLCLLYVWTAFGCTKC